MARAIYEVKLRENYFPALSENDAVDMANSVTDNARLTSFDVVSQVVVPEENTMKLFTLAKTMYDLDRFSFKEIRAAVVALAVEMGYYTIAEQVADMITTWTERVSEDMTPGEFEEWVIG